MADLTEKEIEEQQKVQAALSMKKIYDQVNNLFGGGNQLFSMEFPARKLNPSDYTYTTNDHNSVVNKPQAVAEAEYRLANELFDVSQINSGANGESLSSTYKTVINNFVPKLDELTDFVVDRFILNSWLMEEVVGFVDRDETDVKKKFKGSRMAFSQSIYQLYLGKKNEWNITKEKHRVAAIKKSLGYKIDETTYENFSMDDYTKWLSTTGVIKEEELNSYYSDAVVRGNYHEIQTILGYLNAASTAEALEKTKSNMRNSRKRSLDESMDVYPVQMQPSNWYQYLDSNLSAEDLLSSKESLKMKYRKKEKLLYKAQAHLATLEVVSVDKLEITNLEAEVKTKEKALNAALQKVERSIGGNLFSSINFGFRAVSKLYKGSGILAAYEKNPETITDLVNENSLSEVQIDSKTIKKVLNTHSEHAEALTKMVQLQELKSKKAMLENKDYAVNINIQKIRIASIEKELTSLKKILEDIPLAKKKAEKREDDIRFELGIEKETIPDEERANEILNSVSNLLKTMEKNIAFKKIDFKKKSPITSSIFPKKEVYEEFLKQEVCIYLLDTKDDQHTKYLTKLRSIKEFKVSTMSADFSALNTLIKEAKGFLVDEFKKTITFVAVAKTTQGQIDAIYKQFETIEEDSKKSSKYQKIQAYKIKFSRYEKMWKEAVHHQAFSAENIKKFNERMKKEKGLLPAQINANEDFTEIIIKVSKGESLVTSSTDTTSTEESKRLGWWFYSAVSNDKSSTSSSSVGSNTSSEEFEIAMRVMKVSIDRGGWFDPTILKMSSAFYHLANLPVGSALTADKVKGIFDGGKGPSEIRENLQVSIKEDKTKKYYKYDSSDGERDTTTAHALLPTYPTSFIIVKDVVIRMAADKSSTVSNNSKKSASSVSHSSSWWSSGNQSSSASDSESKEEFSSNEDGSTYIRIPGPQILGWFLQFVPSDNSTPYESLKKAGVDIKEIRKKIEENRLSTNRDVSKEKEDVKSKKKKKKKSKVKSEDKKKD